jgi:phosphoglucomutase
VDPVEDHAQLLKEIFDFEQIKQFFKKNPNFKFLFDGLHGGITIFSISVL